MPDLATVIQAGAANPWLYLPAAVLLGALHALEPGHSKSLMAAFIVAIRGTPAQAVLLGVSAAIGHTIVVWGLAVLGLTLGDALILDRAEPWLVLASGLLVMLLAARLLRSIRRTAHVHEDHGHDHDHDHHHAGHAHEADAHEADAHAHAGDAHAAAHAREIAARFGGERTVRNWEIAWFGFTGGLLPCPAAIAVLLICLQIKALTLGVAMVAAFSLGLAITLIAIGLVAAWGTRRAAAGWSGFDRWAGRLPYISGALVMTLGVFITLRGLWELGALRLV
ncbi:nickel/cobalt efflux transporter [Blastochloris sulfoviridis]|uniref:Nickel/cobalt efflux system n=1 Tax=Blastochloris sulfoviridis TaxID=50712 RepID=A0A5M6HVA6_9HYPH|nr:nickel/cobalt efflux transporter [Blastochloris sulfoviridis]KAA5599489.1 nickel/cobalt efflux transporter RcnA [Blastochloris sulfoviridis]